MAVTLISDLKSAISNSARPNLFECEIQFPDLAAAGISSVEANDSFKFLCKAAAIPSMTIGVVEIPFRGRRVKVPGDRVFDTWTATIMVDENHFVRRAFKEWVNRIDTEIFFSCSPKLWTVAGEKPEKAIKPEIVAEYYQLSQAGQLKFVVGPDDREWEEMEGVIAQFREAGVHWPVWVMPTGAREEEQIAGAGKVAEKAFKRGYNVAARVHVYLFGNAIGT